MKRRERLALKSYRQIAQLPWGMLLSVRISLAFCRRGDRKVNVLHRTISGARNEGPGATLDLYELVQHGRAEAGLGLQLQARLDAERGGGRGQGGRLPTEQPAASETHLLSLSSERPRGLRMEMLGGVKGYCGDKG